MLRFTGPTERISITLPRDMIEYLRLRKYKERISISKQARQALEKDIMGRAEQHLHLVDSPIEYEVERV